MKVEVKPGMPFAASAIARYLDKQIDALKGVKTQREVANDIGYDKPNMISMFKRGEAKVPLDKIPLLAKSLHVDPTHMFRLALEQYWPNMGDMITAMFGRIASENEEKILLQKWRDRSKESDPEATPKIETAVDKMLDEVFGRQKQADDSQV